jgi:hypothetical protein
MSATHKQLGTRPPAAGKAFSERELLLIRTLAPTEAAKQTNRTLTAVYTQRSRLANRNAVQRVQVRHSD